jgi:hypothetical protein
LGFGDEDAVICLAADLDRLNFSELPPDTYIGRIQDGSAARLLVYDEQGREVAERYFAYRNGEIRTRVAFMPSMLTLDKQAIRLDCLGYVMERYSAWPEIAGDAEPTALRSSAAGA